MRKHHTEAIKNAQARLLENNPDILAIIIGGSIAKGIERDDSDIDLVVVLPDDHYRRRLAGNDVAFLWQDLCDYEGGYVEGRFVSRTFIKEAAERGSEPTRHSFTGAYPFYCTDQDIARLLPLIAVYPDGRYQEDMIATFYAQLHLNRDFFWNEAKRRGDKYLQFRAATEIVLFGCRLILAHNRLLFACQKQLIEQTLNAPGTPDDLQQKIDCLLTEMTDQARDDFCNAVVDFVGCPETDCLSRFIQDVEMSWFNRVHAVSEW